MSRNIPSLYSEKHELADLQKTEKGPTFAQGVRQEILRVSNSSGTVLVLEFKNHIDQMLVHP